MNHALNLTSVFVRGTARSLLLAGVVLPFLNLMGQPGTVAIDPPAEDRAIWFTPPDPGSPEALRWDGTWDPAEVIPSSVLPGEGSAWRTVATPHAGGHDTFLGKLLAQRRPLLIVAGLCALLAGLVGYRWFRQTGPPAESAPPPRVWRIAAAPLKADLVTE